VGKKKEKQEKKLPVQTRNNDAAENNQK